MNLKFFLLFSILFLLLFGCLKFLEAKNSDNVSATNISSKRAPTLKNSSSPGTSFRDDLPPLPPD